MLPQRFQQHSLLNLPLLPRHRRHSPPCSSLCPRRLPPRKSHRPPRCVRPPCRSLPLNRSTLPSYRSRSPPQKRCFAPTPAPESPHSAESLHRSSRSLCQIRSPAKILLHPSPVPRLGSRAPRVSNPSG